jgi:capsular exopolysaccharide synthesis family protein
LLAKTLSELGQRVLLVDADLRKPQLHHRLGIDNLVGLSNILSEDQSNWKDTIQPVANQEHWWVLTSGRRPPDPARLLSSHRMHQLAKDLADSGDFDLIIYDTPPSVGLSDAALIAEHLDGLILVVSLNRVDRHLPKEAINRLKGSGTNVLGVVTNALKQERQSNNPYYGARYGYGYGAYGYQTLYNYYGKDDATTNPATAPKGKFKAFRQRLLGLLEN